MRFVIKIFSKIFSRDKDSKLIIKNEEIRTVFLIVYVLTGFLQAYKTSNKSISKALKCLRAWAANWELPYSVKSDSVPAFRQTWEEELEMIGARVIHSSTYN